jgi:hypothetical protein
MTQVLPFRPTAEVLFELRCSTASTRDEVVVVHPENVPLDPRVLALRWLCLPVEQKVELRSAHRLWD